MIRIHYIEEETTYDINSPEEARDEFDKNLARMAVETNSVICMGKFVAEPLWKAPCPALAR